MRQTRPTTRAVLVVSALILSGGCGSDTGSSGEGCSYPANGSAAKKVTPPSVQDVATSGSTTSVLKTTAGDVRITMDRAKAPCTVHSFTSLAQQGYFDQTSCHRLTTSGIFVLQCGDPTGSGSGGPGYSFADETTGEEHYTRGVVAMANSGPDTNGSQFFLVYDDSVSLDQRPNYTVFGAMDAASVAVVAKVAAGGTDRPDDGAPLLPVKITAVTSTTPDGG
ncbi:MAG TPA: peptidylprolyl isomerase [Propionibacteriaceae bacterium]|nr:peptidylprolyl isomerase [Propionibacteriaceae bacterium]